MAAKNDNDPPENANESETDTDPGRPSKKGKGAGAEKGDQRREYRQHSGQTRNSPSSRRGKDDEQSGNRNSS